MNDELKYIKKYYGEKMMHLCRDKFSTILESPGLLLGILKSHFDTDHDLYYDLVKHDKIDAFKNYIYTLIDSDENESSTSLSVSELMSEAGYDFYECHSEKDIQAFKKYYAPGEELCTFRGDRLDSCYVFFAVKKDIKNIRRRDFREPNRQDRYGTSVISIQFARGRVNTLSIKNRYNHKVGNPDATFSNNLENIIPGLSEAFEREYGFKICQSDKNSFELPGYVMDIDGRYHKYCFESNNRYYCKNNIIIDNGMPIYDYAHNERYLFADYYIIDLKDKKIFAYDKYHDRDSFLYNISNIDNISVINKEDGKLITFKIKGKENIYLEIDNDHNIISYKNPNANCLWSRFMVDNKRLKELYLPNVTSVGNSFLYNNNSLECLYMPKVEKVGNFFLRHNNTLKSIYMPELRQIGHDFMEHNKVLNSLYLPNLECVETDFLLSNEELSEVVLPNVRSMGMNAFKNNNKIIYIYCPLLTVLPQYFLYENNVLESLDFDKVSYIFENALYKNRVITNINLPSFNDVNNLSYDLQPYLRTLIYNYLENRKELILNIHS